MSPPRLPDSHTRPAAVPSASPVRRLTSSSTIGSAGSRRKPTRLIDTNPVSTAGTAARCQARQRTEPEARREDRQLGPAPGGHDRHDGAPDDAGDDRHQQDHAGRRAGHPGRLEQRLPVGRQGDERAEREEDQQADPPHEGVADGRAHGAAGLDRSGMRLRSRAAQGDGDADGTHDGERRTDGDQRGELPRVRQGGAEEEGHHHPGEDAGRPDGDAHRRGPPRAGSGRRHR